jgi:hypothetical protein
METLAIWKVRVQAIETVGRKIRRDVMSYQRCQICDEYGWPDTHVCPPTWECYEADESSYRRTIYARDAQEAAEKYAEKIDSELDYCIMKDATESNEETEIVVVTENGEERFLVSAEIVYRYDARRKEGF